jgi:hypothetical protein
VVEFRPEDVIGGKAEQEENFKRLREGSEETSALPTRRTRLDAGEKFGVAQVPDYYKDL